MDKTRPEEERFGRVAVFQKVNAAVCDPGRWMVACGQLRNLGDIIHFSPRAHGIVYIVKAVCMQVF